MTILLKVLVTLFVLLPAKSAATTPLFNSFEELLSVFYRAGYTTVMDVPKGHVVIHQAKVRGPAGTSIQVLSQSVGQVQRIPALDYAGENKPALSLVWKEAYRAYKVGESFLCYQYEGTSYAANKDMFSRCLIFPRPIDEVVLAVSQTLQP